MVMCVHFRVNMYPKTQYQVHVEKDMYPKFWEKAIVAIPR